MGESSTAPASDPRPRLRDLLAAREPVMVAELVPWAGALDDPAGERTRRLASDLEADPRVTALSITDNAGGHARLSPEILARARNEGPARAGPGVISTRPFSVATKENEHE